MTQPAEIDITTLVEAHRATVTAPARVEENKAMLERYGRVFSLPHLPHLTADELKSFLLHKNNKHWWGIHRHGNLITKDMPKLREALGILLDEAQPIRHRLGTLFPKDGPNMIKGLGRAVVTPILLVSQPQRYGVFNRRTESALKLTRLWPEGAGSSCAQQYPPVNSVLTDLARRHNLTLLQLDEILGVAEDAVGGPGAVGEEGAVEVPILATDAPQSRGPMTLREVSAILATKRPFMYAFMEKYLFAQVQVPRTEILSNQQNFDRVIDFCLNTRQRKKLDEFEAAKAHFTDNFGRIGEGVRQGDIEGLRTLVYEAPGVGQKIGNLILEVIIHYGEANRRLEPHLYVPIDSHVRRILLDCLGVDHVPQVGCAPDAPRYLRFQRYLAANAAQGVPPICFDYLWFVGKVLCNKKSDGGRGYSRSWRLCSICWLRKYCRVPDKWLV
ncbi:MAG TPA: hypothetical protein VMW58_05385 [Anaerolineae bacterium]|nr:hypothetical protein [Anaerolineae bacterium]